jgi:hypothetical protein
MNTDLDALVTDLYRSVPKPIPLPAPETTPEERARAEVIYRGLLAQPGMVLDALYHVLPPQVTTPQTTHWAPLLLALVGDDDVALLTAAETIRAKLRARLREVAEDMAEDEAYSEESEG